MNENKKKQVHIIPLVIQKSITPISECKECNPKKNKFIHIHKEDLWQRAKGMYWLLKPTRRAFYEKVILEQLDKLLKLRNYKLLNLEWHDGKNKAGKDVFEGVAVCEKIGDEKIIAPNVNISKELAREIALKELEQWNFDPKDTSKKEKPRYNINKFFQ